MTTAPTLHNFIASSPVETLAGETEAILNPATGETIAYAPVSADADVDTAVRAARAAFPPGQRRRPPRQPCGRTTR